MTLTLNGNPYELAAPCSLTDLLAHLGLTNTPVVIELNQSAIFPRDFPNTHVAPNDRIEIVTLAAGG